MTPILAQSGKSVMGNLLCVVAVWRGQDLLRRYDPTILAHSGKLSTGRDP